MGSIWAAFLLDLVAGDPYWFPHPVRFIGKYVSLVERLVRKLTVSPVGLKIGGVFLTFSTVTMAWFLPVLVLKVFQEINYGLFVFGGVVLMWTCLAAKCLQQESMKIFQALDEGNLIKARMLLSHIVGRDTRELTKSEVIKATVETVVENTSDGIIAPLFYMLIGGAPLALAYKAVNTMDSMVGYKNEKYYYFGWSSARLDDAANYLPARITGIFLVLAAFFLRLDYRAGWRILLRDRRNHTSPNCGYPEAAAAGALGIQLGGTHIYFNQKIVKPTIGDDCRPADPNDIKRAVKMMYIATVLMLIFSTLVGEIGGLVI